MADNCFQVWHCSVNEFVLFCRRLTVSFLPFISLSFSHTHFLIFFSLPLFSCYLASIFTLSLALWKPSLSLSLLNLSPSFLSVPHSLARRGFLHLCFTRCSLSLFCLLAECKQQKNSLFCYGLFHRK